MIPSGHFPPAGMPEDVDGTGDWTVAGWEHPYSPEEWEGIKNTLFRHRHTFGLRTAYVSDKANADRSRRDPAAVSQFILGIPVGIGIVLMFLVLIAACIAPWVMR